MIIYEERFIQEHVDIDRLHDRVRTICYMPNYIINSMNTMPEAYRVEDEVVLGGYVISYKLRVTDRASEISIPEEEDHE